MMKLAIVLALGGATGVATAATGRGVPQSLQNRALWRKNDEQLALPRCRLGFFGFLRNDRKRKLFAGLC